MLCGLHNESVMEKLLYTLLEVVRNMLVFYQAIFYEILQVQKSDVLLKCRKFGCEGNAKSNLPSLILQHTS